MSGSAQPANKHKAADTSPSPGDTTGQLPFLTPESVFPSSFLSLTSVLDSGVLVVNTERQVCFLNDQAAEILAMHRDIACGQGLIALLRDYQVDMLVQEVLADGEVRETTIQPVSSQRTLRLRCTPFASNVRQDGAMLLIRDVTQISMLERARRDLVANVSHELRTPLTSLKLLVETLQSEPPLEIARRMMGKMDNEIDAVIRLAEELHELSQIETGRVVMQFSPGHIGDVIERALERVHTQTEQKQIRILAHMEQNKMRVLIDEHRIGQVLLNLLHNAIKFTPAEGEIIVQTQVVLVDEKTLRVEYIDDHVFDLGVPLAELARRKVGQYATARNADNSEVRFPLAHPPGLWMLISIRDTGIGIPSEDLPRIFERFYKVDRSRTREAGGTGLGLAIAKHLIEGHGGRLWADSEEGRGSIFYFTLPVV